MTNPVLPSLAGLAFPFKRSPVWSTIQQTSVGGQTPRFAMWSYPRWRYELVYDVLRTHGSYTEQQQLVGFYNGLSGSALAFQFTDPDDTTVTAQSFGTGDGTTTAFQLVRTYGSFTEPVYAPTGTPAIYKAAVLQTVTTDYTIGSTGIVTFTSPPAAAAALTWTGSFNWLAQFDEDSLEFQKDFYGRWQLASMKFTTIKL